MSIYDKASLIQIPSGYKAGELYSVIPNSGAGDFTHTRNGTAKRVNSQGLIETVNANVPRLDYPFIDGVVQDCPHLLLERQSTNLLTYSEDFTQWTKQNVTATSNELISPNGIQNADKILETTANSFHFAYNGVISATLSTDYTYSIFVKKLGRQYVGIQSLFNTTKGAIALFDLDNGSLVYTFQHGGHTINNANIYNFGNDWYKITATFQFNDSTAIFGVITADDLWTTGTAYNNPYIGDVTKGVYVYGAQVEQASYPTSYISTNGSSVTRLVDQCEITSGLEDVIGQTEGTLFIDFEYLYETTTDSSTDAFRDYFTLGNTADLSEYIAFDNYRSQFRIFIAGSGMTTISIGNNSTGASQPNTRYKLAVKYKTGDCKAYLNGSLLGSSTGTVNFASVLNGIFFSYNDTNRALKNQKKVYGLMMFKEALSDSELETITSYSSFNSMATALGYKII